MVQARRLLQAATVGVVLTLLTVLVWHLAARRGGSALVGEVARKQMPVAPPFALPVIWMRVRRGREVSRMSLRAIRWPWRICAAGRWL